MTRSGLAMRKLLDGLDRNDARGGSARIEGPCCGPADASGTCCSGEIAGFGPELYALTDRAGLPDAAVLATLGCGNPTAVAELREGERVLDLGSGGGIDVLLSAQRVGPTGRAFGLDMTDEMLALARRNAAEAGATNVEFLKGTIEAIPLPAASIDVVISNCVINLAADKPAVLAEIARVLRPGGRIGISDIVADDALSPAERAERGTYVGCIAGALSFDEYPPRPRAVGFADVAVAPDARGRRRHVVGHHPGRGSPRPDRPRAVSARGGALDHDRVDAEALQASEVSRRARSSAATRGRAGVPTSRDRADRAPLGRCRRSPSEGALESWPARVRYVFNQRGHAGRVARATRASAASNDETTAGSVGSLPRAVSTAAARARRRCRHRHLQLDVEERRRGDGRQHLGQRRHAVAAKLVRRRASRPRASTPWTRWPASRRG